jgi:hypothetical protein
MRAPVRQDDALDWFLTAHIDITKRHEMAEN